MSTWAVMAKVFDKSSFLEGLPSPVMCRILREAQTAHLQTRQMCGKPEMRSLPSGQKCRYVHDPSECQGLQTVDDDPRHSMRPHRRETGILPRAVLSTKVNDDRTGKVLVLLCLVFLIHR
jgi:hypothetical protein